MTTTPQLTRVVYLVVCAAPPSTAVSELVRLLQRKGWTVCVVATPSAANWIDRAVLAELTGLPVRHEHRQPDDSDTLPLADAIAVAPATFNTINKWVAGISDNFALGLLNEALGLKLPIVVAPYAKATLAAHPAFGQSLRTLSEWGVRVLLNEVIRKAQIEKPQAEPDSRKHRFNWEPIVEALD